MHLNLYFGVFIILASAYGKSTTVIASSKHEYKLETFLSSKQKWSNGAKESEGTTAILMYKVKHKLCSTGICHLFQMTGHPNGKIKLVVIKDYESAFDAVTLIQIP